MYMLRSNFQKPAYRSLEFRQRNTERLRDFRCGSSGNVTSNFDEVQLAVANDDLVGRQIVVDVRQMDRQNFVAKKREGLEWIEGIDGQKTSQLAMLANRFHGAIQRRHRVIAQQESDARIILSASLAIQSAKTIEP